MRRCVVDINAPSKIRVAVSNGESVHCNYLTIINAVENKPPGAVFTVDDTGGPAMDRFNGNCFIRIKNKISIAGACISTCRIKIWRRIINPHRIAILSRINCQLDCFKVKRDIHVCHCSCGKETPDNTGGQNQIIYFFK